MAYCGNCGNKLDDGAKFCPQCGAKCAHNGKQICSKCGTELNEGAKFCPKCGAKNNSNSSGKRKSQVMIWYIAAFISLIVIFGGGWYLYLDSLDKEAKRIAQEKVEEEQRVEEERKAEEERKRIEEENKPSNKFYQVANQGRYVWECVNGNFHVESKNFRYKPNRLFLYFYPSSKHEGKVTVATYYPFNACGIGWDFVVQFTNRVSYSVVDNHILFTYSYWQLKYTIEYRLRIENDNGKIRLVRSDGQTYVQSKIDVRDPFQK